MPTPLHPAQTRADLITGPAQFGRVGESLATVFEIVKIPRGLVFAPLPERVARNVGQIGFRAHGKAATI